MAKLAGLAQQVPAIEAELAKINRDYGIIKSNYETLLSRRESARISEDREVSSEKVQYRLVDPAEVPAFPSGPPRLIFLTIVLLAAIGAGIGFAWVLVVLDDTYSDVSTVAKDQGATIEIHELDERWAGPWDTFVEAHAEATFFHRAGWKAAIEEGFKHRGRFLLAVRGGEVSGVLPLVHVKSRIFGNALVSSAFCVYGGPIPADGESHAALDAAARDLARELGVDYLEYRSRTRVHDDWACNSKLYAAFRKSLDPEPEKNLLAIPRKQRAMVRKGIKAGLVSERDDDIDRFYRIYSESVRDHGTPVFSERYFRALKSRFGAACEISTVVHRGRPVSSVMSFRFRDEVLPYYGGAARGLAAFDFMYWDVMRRACEAGARVYDYGRSKRGTGSFSFKQHWGFQPEPLHYEFDLLRRSAPPENNPLNPKYRLMIAAWQRLPLRVANLIGPHLARGLG